MMPQVTPPGDNSGKLAAVGDLDGTAELIEDGRGGYARISPAQKQRAEAVFREQRERREALARYVDPTQLAAARQRREAEEKRTEGPPKRELLDAAHTALTAAEGEVARLEDALTKARNFRDEAETSLREAERGFEAAEEAAAGRLIASFTGSEAETGLPEPETGAAAELDQTKRAFEVASAALARLEADLEAARKLTGRRNGETRRAVHALLTDLACARAEKILDLDFELRTERAELQALALMLSNMGRSNFTAPPALPAKVSRACYPPDPALTGKQTQGSIPWQALYNALAADPQARLPGEELVSDEPEPA
jgi:hypothetical protein